MHSLPFVSIIIPCRNEERFIEACLRSILANDYPRDQYEIIVVDGASTDSTRVRILSFCQQHPNIILFANAVRYTPVSLNLAIRKARGAVIMRMDAHALYRRNYISRCVYYLQEYNADNVGGLMETLPRLPGLLAQAIALVLSHRFGVGNSPFRTSSTAIREVDTVVFGCYRRDVFDRIGFFNEQMHRSQDIELNLRLRKHGGKIILFPEVLCSYYPPGDIRSFMIHSYRNGIWATYPHAITGSWLSWRHYIPLFFVIALVLPLFLAVVNPLFVLMSIVVAVLYAITAITASVFIAIRHRQWGLVRILPAVFFVLHSAYGFGSIVGLCKRPPPSPKTSPYATSVS